MTRFTASDIRVDQAKDGSPSLFFSGDQLYSLFNARDESVLKVVTSPVDNHYLPTIELFSSTVETQEKAPQLESDQKLYQNQLPQNEIKRDFPPQTRRQERDQGLREIAQERIGPKATDNEISQYVEEICVINGWVKKGDYLIERGQSIKLPGHTIDGGLITVDAKGTTFIYYDSPEKCRVQYQDGIGYERMSDGEGGRIERHFGPRREDSFTVKIAKDGTIESDRSPDWTPENLPSEAEKLRRLIDSKVLLTTERQQIKESMNRFEERGRRDSLSESELAATYLQISRILSAPPNSTMTERERVRLALGAMRAAANPSGNDQGDFSTCSVTTVENRLYLKQPSVAAGILADIAHSGKFIARDGTHVELDPVSLRAHHEGALNKPENTNYRSYASQIFQVAAVNVHYVKENERKIPPGNIRYNQVPPIDASDSGERLRDHSKTEARVIDKGPSLSMGDAMIIHAALTGRNEKDIFLKNENVIKRTGEAKLSSFSTAEELHEKLKYLKESGRLPLYFAVRSANDPFFSDSDIDFKSLSEDDLINDGHIILLTDYDASQRQCRFDNQWGSKHDALLKPVSLEQLFAASDRMRADTWLQRLDNKQGPSSAQTEAALKTIMETYLKTWHREQQLAIPAHPNEESRANELLQKMLHTLAAKDPRRAQAVSRHIENVKRGLK